ncbi:MAG: hypothetical protein ACYTGG_08805 [Planctomycetota bacterium]|jgi:hypothetical protein
MLAINGGIFLRRPQESAKRILHPATVKEIRDKVYTVALEEPLRIEAGDEILVYYEIKREFMQQPARVDAVLTAEPDADGDDTGGGTPKMVIGLETTGEPVSAESRQCYRVSIVLSGLTVQLGSEEGCQLLDVSASGFSVIAAADYKIGKIVPAVLLHDGRSYKGKACVQGVCKLEPGRTRYGLYCVEDCSVSGDLLKGMQTISMAVQRQQLRRLAGSA